LSQFDAGSELAALYKVKIDEAYVLSRLFFRDSGSDLGISRKNDSRAGLGKLAFI
jgi:hypothetical protein